MGNMAALITRHVILDESFLFWTSIYPFLQNIYNNNNI